MHHARLLSGGQTIVAVTLIAVLGFGVEPAAAQSMTSSGGAMSTDQAVELDLELDLPLRDVATAVAWSNDGSRLAAASFYGGVLTVWDSTGHRINEFRRSGRGPYPGNSLAFGNNAGTLLVTVPRPGAPADAALTIWDVETGKSVRDVEGPTPGRGLPFNQAWNFAVSQDGRWAAAAPLRVSGPAVTIYDTTTWQPSQQIALARGGATGLAFSDDGRLLAIGTMFGDVVIVNAQDGHRLITIAALERTLSRSIGALAFNPDNSLLAAGTGLGITAVQIDTPVRVFNVRNGSPVSAYRDGDQLIRKLVWMHHTGVLAFVCSDHTVRIWRPNTPSLSALVLQFSNGLTSLASTVDGRRLAIADGTHIKVYRFDRPK